MMKWSVVWLSTSICNMDLYKTEEFATSDPISWPQIIRLPYTAIPPVKSNIKIGANKPDFLIIDKRNRFGLVVEVDITSTEFIRTREFKKEQKYMHLAYEIIKIHILTKVDVVPMI
ncbi:MAG: hypothetical protein MHPSP_001548 [Paramarteilia canceri]